MEKDTEKQSFSLLGNLKSVTAIVDLNAIGWEKCQQMLSAMIDDLFNTELVYIDLQRKRRQNPWNTPAERTFFKNDFSFWGKCKAEELLSIIERKTDIFICLSTETDKKIENLVLSNHSRIKIGIVDLPSAPYDVIIGAPEGTKLAEDKVMVAISTYLKNVTWK